MKKISSLFRICNQSINTFEVNYIFPNKLYMDGITSIRNFSREKIIIIIKDHKFIINGSGLEAKLYNDHEVFIEGEIKSMEVR